MPQSIHEMLQLLAGIGVVISAGVIVWLPALVVAWATDRSDNER